MEITRQIPVANVGTFIKLWPFVPDIKRGLHEILVGGPLNYLPHHKKLASSS